MIVQAEKFVLNEQCKSVMCFVDGDCPSGSNALFFLYSDVLVLVAVQTGDCS